MAEENEFPKEDGDALYASEVNDIERLSTFSIYTEKLKSKTRDYLMDFNMIFDEEVTLTEEYYSFNNLTINNTLNLNSETGRTVFYIYNDLTITSTGKINVSRQGSKKIGGGGNSIGGGGGGSYGGGGGFGPTSSQGVEGGSAQTAVSNFDLEDFDFKKEAILKKAWQGGNSYYPYEVSTRGRGSVIFIVEGNIEIEGNIDCMGLDGVRRTVGTTYYDGGGGGGGGTIIIYSEKNINIKNTTLSSAGGKGGDSKSQDEQGGGGGSGGGIIIIGNSIHIDTSTLNVKGGNRGWGKYYRQGAEGGIIVLGYNSLTENNETYLYSGGTGQTAGADGLVKKIVKT